MEAKELYNQNLSETIADDERLSFSKPGVIGAKNILFSKFKILLATIFASKSNVPEVIKYEAIAIGNTITIEANTKLYDFDVEVISGTLSSLIVSSNSIEYVNETNFETITNFVLAKYFSNSISIITTGSGTINIYAHLKKSYK